MPMSDDWDFYLTIVDGNPASIFVDLAAVEDAPVAGMGQMVFLKVFMRSPRTDGLSSAEEFDALAALEDKVVQAAQDAGLRYVGRQTTSGFRDLIFYAASGAAEQVLAEAVLAFPDYRFETGSRPDPDWDIYLDYLLPDDPTRQGMLNRRIYEQLDAHDDDTDTPREIDHWASFPSAYERSIFVDECKAKGFELRSLSGPDENSDQYWARIFRVDTPDGETFDVVTATLVELAAESGGKYDGWETPIVPPANPPSDSLLGRFFGKKG